MARISVLIAAEQSRSSPIKTAARDNGRPTIVTQATPHRGRGLRLLRSWLHRAPTPGAERRRALTCLRRDVAALARRDFVCKANGRDPPPSAAIRLNTPQYASMGRTRYAIQRREAAGNYWQLTIGEAKRRVNGGGSARLFAHKVQLLLDLGSPLAGRPSLAVTRADTLASVKPGRDL